MEETEKIIKHLCFRRIPNRNKAQSSLEVSYQIQFGIGRLVKENILTVDEEFPDNIFRAVVNNFQIHLRGHVY